MRFILISILIWTIPCQSCGQAKAVKKITERVTARSAKRTAYEMARQRTYKELVREGLERTGRKYTGEALGERIAKRALRESVLEKMEKEGMESFLEYGRAKAFKDMELMGASNCKRMLIAKDAATANRPSAYHFVMENSNTARKNISSVGTKAERKYLESAIKKSLLYGQLQGIIAKGAIKLSQKELDYLLTNPSQIRVFIRTHTGSNKEFAEFFIRLAMNGNEGQVKLLLCDKTINKYVKNSIRRKAEGGGMHEWLMTKNFQDFLTNPKWGNDGFYLALALTKMVQKTENVIFKGVGRHPTSGVNNSRESTAFHNGLARIIDKCSTKEEVFIAVKGYAKQHLAPQAYKEFKQIFADVFRRA